VQLDLPGGNRLHVINVHLKSKIPTDIPGQNIDGYTWRSADAWAKGSFISSMKRMSQALEVRRLIDQILDTDPAAQIVVAGDFNAVRDEVPIMAIRGHVENTSTADLVGQVLVPIEHTIAAPARYTVTKGTGRYSTTCSSAETSSPTTAAQKSTTRSSTTSPSHSLSNVSIPSPTTRLSSPPSTSKPDIAACPLSSRKPDAGRPSVWPTRTISSFLRAACFEPHRTRARSVWVVTVVGEGDGLDVGPIEVQQNGRRRMTATGTARGPPQGPTHQSAWDN
jgi:hypothetical protein